MSTQTDTAVPEMLRVEEAAELLRISRSFAYRQANLYLTTGGAEGLPAMRIGRAIRVPKQALLGVIGVVSES